MRIFFSSSLLYSTLTWNILVFWKSNKIKAVELKIDALYKNRGHRPRYFAFSKNILHQISCTTYNRTRTSCSRLASHVHTFSVQNKHTKWNEKKEREKKTNERSKKEKKIDVLPSISNEQQTWRNQSNWTNLSLDARHNNYNNNNIDDAATTTTI